MVDTLKIVEAYLNGAKIVGQSYDPLGNRSELIEIAPDTIANINLRALCFEIQSLSAQLEEANGTIGRYERKKDDAGNVYACLFRDYTTLQELFKVKEVEYKENQRIAIEALEFYANKDNYYLDNGIPVFDSSQEIEVTKDEGKIAEQALLAIRGK